MALNEPNSISAELATAAEVAAWMAARHADQDVLTAGLVDRFRVMLGRGRSDDATVPLGLHMCLAPEAIEAEKLGPDGLPREGGWIPRLRLLTGVMYGGAAFEFLEPLRFGDTVERVSRLAGLTEKSGRSGRLAFARIRHEYRVAGALRIAETQTLLFRVPAAAPSVDGPVVHEPWDFRRSVTPTETMLFRYSALTFNPHRIHYDHPYATGVEHFPGLVVHGPLTATLLLDTCAEQVGAAGVRRFEVRAERPAYCDGALTLAGRIEGDTVTLAALDETGRAVMRATAELRA
jgi:3-methylfumaryl-CoA hydratase